MKSEGFKDEADFDADFKKAEKDLAKHRKKDAVDGEDQEEEEPSFPLLDTPDDQVCLTLPLFDSFKMFVHIIVSLMKKA